MMISISDYMDAVIAAMRDIPQIVALVGGDPLNLTSFRFGDPQYTNLQEAIRKMAAPSAMLVWQGSQAGGDGYADGPSRRFSVFYRAARPTAGDDYYSWERWFFDGVPASGDGSRLITTQLSQSTYPIAYNNSPLIPPMRTDIEGIVYMETQFTATEIGGA